MDLSRDQIKIIESDLNSAMFLYGPAGTGKSTTGLERLNYLVRNGIPGNRILLLFPQRTLSAIYQDFINSIAFQGNSLPVIATFGGLARRTIELYWPIIASETGLFNPGKLPTFLTLESTLYFISQLITPLITDEGYFSSVTIQRNRLFSQILDNLNKAAIHGFPHTEISERLQSSWIGDPSQFSIFQDAQNTAALFREYCYQHNLLDYSLQVEMFVNHLLHHDNVQTHFKKQYKHLIYDNVEEDVPVAHDFIKDMLPTFDSSLLIYDLDAGYRSFLGASPSGGKKLSDLCTNKIMLHLQLLSNSILCCRPPWGQNPPLLKILNHLSPIRSQLTFTLIIPR
jgi:superfamily I DNA/RNA helicase